MVILSFSVCPPDCYVKPSGLDVRRITFAGECYERGSWILHVLFSIYLLSLFV